MAGKLVTTRTPSDACNADKSAPGFGLTRKRSPCGAESAGVSAGIHWSAPLTSSIRLRTTKPPDEFDRTCERIFYSNHRPILSITGCNPWKPLENTSGRRVCIVIDFAPSALRRPKGYAFADRGKHLIHAGTLSRRGSGLSPFGDKLIHSRNMPSLDCTHGFASFGCAVSHSAGLTLRVSC